MGCKFGRCNKTSTPQGIFIVIQSIQGWEIKVKEAPSPLLPMTHFTGHQPSILPKLYSPVPNNSPPPCLLVFEFLSDPPFLFGPPRLLIFQILFCRYFRDC